MVDALTFFNPAVDPDAIVPADYTISNVDAQGNIVPFYSNIVLNHKYDVADIVDYYHIPSIGKAGNTEIHLFQIFDEDSLTDTVEWVAMDHGGYSPFVPFYPLLTKVHLTKIDAAPFSDSFFPDLDAAEEWHCTQADEWAEHEGVRYQFSTYERK